MCISLRQSADKKLISDPCSNFLGLNGGRPASAQVRNNCIALGVPANGSYTQLNAQISVVTGGNPSLNPETSRGITVGSVYSPKWISRSPVAQALTLEANYSSIRVNGAIQPLDAQLQLNRCAQTLDATSCANISRTASGVISNFSNQLVNIGSMRTRSVDWTLRVTSKRSIAGEFILSSINSYLLDYTEFVPVTTGFTEISRPGTERGSPDQAYPRFKSNTTLDWRIGKARASSTGRYIAGVRETADGNLLRNRYYGDVQLGWDPTFSGQPISFALGVNNIFGTQPPGCGSCSLNNFDPTTYDIPGRYGYFRISLKR